MSLDICIALANKIKQELTQENVGTKYFHDIYGNVATISYIVQDVPAFPMVTVTQGPEEYEYQAAGVRWTFLRVYVRAYYKDEYDSERQIRLLLRDLKKILDTPERIQYTISNPDGTTEPRFVAIDNLSGLTTDEGILRPIAIGELSITLKYCEDGRII